MLWTKEMADPMIDLVLWQRFREPKYACANIPNGNPHELMMSASRALFTKRQLALHRWAERMIESYTNTTGYLIWLGAGSSGKSHMAGLCLLLDYIAAFAAADDNKSDDGNAGDITGSLYGMLVSTSKDALAKRSLASAVEFLGYLRGGDFAVPFKFISNKFAIVPETVNDENIASFKARIDGVALAEGSEVESRGRVIGVHLPRVRVIADEFENLSEARANSLIVAQSNLRAGCSDYKALFLSNPQGRDLPCSRLAAPEGGWSKVTLKDYEWLSATGARVLRFDGLDSPGVEDPKQFPFLPTAEYIKDVRKANGGEDTPGFWAFVRAYPPEDMGTSTIITPDMVEAWGMRKTVEWESPPLTFASLDPAFTSGGDTCMMARGWVGRERGVGRLVLCFDSNLHAIPISASSGVPVLQQIGHAAKDKLFEWGVPMDRFAVDDSGTQSVADYMEIISGRGLYRCNYSKKPPAVPSSVNPIDTIDKRYRNTVTWLYYNMHELAQYGQIKGLPDRAVDELCSRQLDRKLKGLLVIETKPAFKKRMKDGRSPDAADACVMLAGMVRHRFGFVPGSNSFVPSGSSYEDDFDPGEPGGLTDLAREYNSMECLESEGRYS
jgi:hypothetical protein